MHHDDTLTWRWLSALSTSRQIARILLAHESISPANKPFMREGRVEGLNALRLLHHHAVCTMIADARRKQQRWQEPSY